MRSFKTRAWLFGYFFRTTWKLATFILTILVIFHLYLLHREAHFLAGFVLLPAIPLSVKIFFHLFIRQSFRDTVFDSLVDNALDHVRDNARKRLEIGSSDLSESEIKQFIIYGRSHHAAKRWGLFTRSYRVGADRSVRSKVYMLTAVLLGEDRFGIFSCHHDVVNDEYIDIRITEALYDRVSHLSLEEDLEARSDGEVIRWMRRQRSWWKFWKMDEVFPRQTLVLIVDGKKYPIALDLPPADERESVSEIESTVMAIRNELRDRVERPSDDSW